MSVSKWAYDPRYCDGGGCPGDCDLCNKPRDMEGEMDDCIKRKDAIDAIRASTSKYTGFMEMEMYTDDDAVEAINGVPSAHDVVEVVRCKDCRYWENGRCYLLRDATIEVRDNDYCSYGERADT